MLGLAALLTVAQVAVAADPYALLTSRAFKACDAAAADPNASAGCAAAEADRQEKLLAAEWKAARAALPAAHRGLGDAAQAAWRRYREADCGLGQAIGLGAYDAALSAETCRMQRTIERRMALKGYPELHD